MSWLKEQTGLLGGFLRADFRVVLRLCALTLALSALVGFAIAYAAPEVVDKVLEAFMNQIQEAGVVDETGELSVFALLMNNWRAMLTSAIWGLIPFLFLPVLSLFVNGALVGLLGGWVLQRGGSLAFYCAGILPHGGFEIPALVLSAACGVYLCWGLCRIILNRPDKVAAVELFSELLRVLVLVVAPLTVCAAFIECYITPVVMAFFM